MIWILQRIAEEKLAAQIEVTGKVVSVGGATSVARVATVNRLRARDEELAELASPHPGSKVTGGRDG